MANVTQEEMAELLQVAGDVNFLNGFLLGMTLDKIGNYTKEFYIKMLKKQVENDFMEQSTNRRIKMIEDNFHFKLPYNLDL